MFESWLDSAAVVAEGGVVLDLGGASVGEGLPTQLAGPVLLANVEGAAVSL